jgi:hypothetical protein
LAKSDEQWFAQLRLEVERVTRAHMQVRSAETQQSATFYASRVPRKWTNASVACRTHAQPVMATALSMLLPCLQQIRT